MKHKKLICLALSSVLALSMVAFAACNDTPPEDENKDPSSSQATLVPTKKYSLPSEDEADLRTTNVAVHDPSVFYDENSETYYAFGTHYAVASSKNLVKWTQNVEDKEWDKLYGTESYTKNGTRWPMALKDTVDLVAPVQNSDPITTTWAPDVNYHNGKYYMYYSLTQAFGSSRSAIARVESDNVMGPYSGNKILFSSDGTGTSNAIDPELFTDKNGGLWMVYGSTYGGIFLVELYNEGENWGLPKEEIVEGTPAGEKIWAGGNNVEGPFIFYNDLTDYYYLMTSYGALMYTYNMRIARSKNPNGPYEDITGQKMLDVAPDGSGGNKVAGSYRFAGQEGNGYAALGHNSVVKDKTGRYFVIYHARRQGTFTSDDSQKVAGVDARHHLFVSQLYFNEEGWPVMSPTAYVGEKAGLITQSEAAGDYKIVVHTKGITAKPVTSVTYTLTEDGKVTSEGTEVGTWLVKQDYYVEITLDGVTYKGVLAPGWDTYACYDEKTAVFAITAIANLTDAKQGGSLWAISARA